MNPRVVQRTQIAKALGDRVHDRDLSDAHKRVVQLRLMGFSYERASKLALREFPSVNDKELYQMFMLYRSNEKV